MTTERASDAAAFYAAHRLDAARWAVALTGRRDIGEDLAQDALLRTAAKLATYDTRDQARAPEFAKDALVAPPQSPADADELATLRADYEALAERKPLGFWKADKLRVEIDRLRAERDAAPGGDDTPTDGDPVAPDGDAA